LYRNTTDRLYCRVSTVAWQIKWNKMKSCVSTHPVFVPTDSPQMDDSHQNNIPWKVQTRSPCILIEVYFIVFPSHSKKILGHCFKLWPPHHPNFVGSDSLFSTNPTIPR